MSIKKYNIKDCDYEVAIYLPNSFLDIADIQFLIEYLDNKKINYLLITRKTRVFRKLKSYSIAYAKKPVDVENIIQECKNLKKIYFIVHHPRNIHITRYQHLEHIFMVKNRNIIDKSYRQYDTLIVDNNHTIDIDTRHLKIIHSIEDSLN
jgi:hypothetical protein